MSEVQIFEHKTIIRELMFSDSSLAK